MKRQSVHLSGLIILTGLLNCGFAQTSFNISNKTTGDTLLTIDNSGNMGIGITTPTVRIDAVSSNPDVGALLRLANYDISHFLRLYSGRTNNPDPYILWNAGSALRFGTGFSQELMRLTSEGRLGIGTADPTEMLEVADTIYSKVGGFKFPDGSVQETAAGSGSGNGNTLDQAYDQGGAGAGRTITADNGAVTIAGVDGFLSTGITGSGSIPAEGAGTRMMWYPRKAAFRVGEVTGSLIWDDDSIGTYSFASGRNTRASGNSSTALGDNTEASGTVSTAMGNDTRASGDLSTAMGYLTKASGFQSMAMGNRTVASGDLSMAMGSNTEASGNFSMAMGSNTKASGEFSIAMGNEIEANGYGSFALNLGGQNGLTVTQPLTMAIVGGSVGIEEVAPSAELHVGGVDGVLFTGTTGSGSIPAEGAGTRMMWYPRKAAFRVGEVTGSLIWDDDSIGTNSFASGRNTRASGNSSTALGDNTEASGTVSTAMGNDTRASGDLSTAMGYLTKASGFQSMAMGNRTVASGDLSMAMGSNTEASGNFSMAMGSNTKASGEFSIAMGNQIEANGYGSFALNLGGQNGLTVTQPLTMAIVGGSVGIGTVAPSAGLHLSGTGYPSSFMFIESTDDHDAGLRLYEGSTAKWHIFNNATLDGLQIYNTGGANTVFFADQSTGHVGIGRTNPNYQLHAEINGSTAVAMFENDNQGSNSDGIIIKAGPILNPGYDVDYIFFQDGNGDIIGQISGNGAGGVAYVTTSDERLKTNIRDYSGGLEKISEIQVRNYEMQSAPGKERIGLIAQELQKVYPEAVNGSPDSDVNEEPMMIDYGRITPILISAIQEINDEKDEEIADLRSIITELTNRIEKLENK